MRIALFLLLLCGLSASLPAAERPLRVVTLHTVLTELAKQVGGGDVVVQGLVRAGIDPHAFEPSATDVRTLADADLILAAGLSLERYLDRIVDNAADAKRVVRLGDRLPNPICSEGHDHSADHGHDHGELDPHWWHSPANVITATRIIAEELASRDPAHADRYQTAAAAAIAHLQGLQVWAQTEIARIPPARRVLITSHDAFGYLARDLGLRIHPIAGLSSDGEPDARTLAELTKTIRREKIPAIFPEATLNPRLAQMLVSETGIKLGGLLYADGLGPKNSNADTYEAMYRHNVSAIVAALRL